MIIARAPLRVSLFGGGTDLPDYFVDSNRMGNVVGGSINLYVYVNVMPLSPEAQEKVRFTYRVTESVQNCQDLTHPAMRKILEIYAPDKRLNISTMSSVPGNSGLGSSSAFVVAALEAVLQFQGYPTRSRELAEKAIEIEREILKEPGGLQDQFHAAIGGFRHYSFSSNGNSISEELIDESTYQFLSERSFLIYTGSARDNSLIKTASINRSKSSNQDLDELSNQARRLSSHDFWNKTHKHLLSELAHNLKLSWKWKRSSLNVSDLLIFDQMYEKAMASGALAGKLLGAGGGGYFFFLVDKESQSSFMENFSTFHLRRVQFTRTGVTSNSF